VVAGVEELSRGRLQRLGRQQRPAGLGVALGGGQQPGGIMIEQAAAIQRVRLPVRDLRAGGQGRGVARQGLGGR